MYTVKSMWSLPLLAATTSSLLAQTDSAARDPRLVQPERPTVATHAGTVARGYIELEQGGEWDRQRDATRTFFAPTNLKIGLASRAQLNILFNVIHDRKIRGGTFALGDLALGIKYRIVDGDRLLGDFAILPAIKLPTAAPEEAGTGTTDFSLLLISSRQLGPVAMDLNVGQTRRSGDGNSAPRVSNIWTASFGMPLSGALGATLEFFGYPGTGGALGTEGSAAILIGPTFLARKWLSLDAGIISPLTGPQAHAVYVGFVWNAGCIDRKSCR
jgi:hypothetical protein